MSIIPAGTTSGVVDLKGQVFANQTIRGVNGDPANPIVLTNGKLVNVRFENSSHFIVRGAAILGDNSGAPVEQIAATALYIRACHHFRIEACDLSRARLAMQVIDCADFDIDANDIHDIRTDTFRPTNCENYRFTRNLMHDWHLAVGDHCDAVQPLNTTLGHDAVGVVIEDNCAFRGNGSIAQGICIRWYGPPKNPGYTGFVNAQVNRNLLIGMAANGMDLRWPGITAQDNEVVSFPDVESRILAVPEATLIGNKAKRYAVGGFSNTAPAGNELNKPVDPSQEAALVAAWRARMFPAPAPAPQPEPTPIPVPIPEPTSPPELGLTDAQKAKVIEAVTAAIAAL